MPLHTIMAAAKTLSRTNAPLPSARSDQRHFVDGGGDGDGAQQRTELLADLRALRTQQYRQLHRGECWFFAVSQL
jgi:hypothetical protein